MDWDYGGSSGKELEGGVDGEVVHDVSIAYVASCMNTYLVWGKGSEGVTLNYQ